MYMYISLEWIIRSTFSTEQLRRNVGEINGFDDNLKHLLFIFAVNEVS